MKGLSGVVVGTDVTDDISSRILSMDVSLTTDMASQISFTISDPGLLMMRANYFQVRQVVTYLGTKWEMAAVEVQNGQAGEQVMLECRLQAVQKLKRDKGSKTFHEGSATAFAAARAAEVGLSFFGENTAAKGTISRVRNDKTDESTWDVLSRLAGDNQFWCFESDGRLFFTSQQFLLGKFAIVPDATTISSGFLSTRIDWTTNGKVIQRDTQPTLVQKYPPIAGPTGRPVLSKGATGTHVRYFQTVVNARAGQNIVVDGIFGNQTLTAVKALQQFFAISENGVIGAQTWGIVDFLASGLEQVGGISPLQYSIIPVGVPGVRKSDDAPEEMSLSLKVEREIGRTFRPGMTVFVDGVPGFEANCLVTEVSWMEGTPDPVSISARTVEIPRTPADKVKALKKINLTGGGFSSGSATGVL
jgi:hypothetical protein